jgi:hypothetical protein
MLRSVLFGGDEGAKMSHAEQSAILDLFHGSRDMVSINFGKM